ncbi:MAG: hypothetical protein ACT443_08520, partial [Gemmatimonadota bacterium]
TMSAGRLWPITWLGLFAPNTVADAVRAIDRGARIAANQAERTSALYTAAYTFLAYGMPSRAAEALDALVAIAPDPVEIHSHQILAALYGSGDQGHARTAVAALEDKLDSGPLASNVRARCAREQWRLWNRETDTHRATVEQLSRIDPDSAFAKLEADVCIRVLATVDALLNKPATLTRRVHELNAIMRDGPAIHSAFANASNIVLARAAEGAGDRALAYRAASRIAFHPMRMFLHSTMLREAARLAALRGDTERAIRLYRRYLNAHELAEPALKQEDDAARTHLAQLTGERR